MSAEPLPSGDDDIDYRKISTNIGVLYGDTQRCAAAAGLAYVSAAEPGIRRRRFGRGFGYRSPDGRPLDDQDIKARILQLAIPPAWKNVWICPDADGHILAIGEDDRGRKQYIYHERWRELRDLLNFYRLINFAEHLPPIRRHVAVQLRRRTLDRDRVLATMIHIVDSSGMRIGSEVYAEENESFGLTTLTRRHVRVVGEAIRFVFPAKSHQQADITLHDKATARVLSTLLAQRRQRLFAVGGKPIEASEVNELLLHLTGEHITAKDFRTWRGTSTAFRYLVEHRDAEDRERTVVAAVDAAADALRNTRAVARAHYVHPHVLRSFVDGTFDDDLAASGRRRLPTLDGHERMLVAFLVTLLEREFDASIAS